MHQKKRQRNSRARRRQRVKDREARLRNERVGPIIQGHAGENPQHQAIMNDIRKKWRRRN